MKDHTYIRKEMQDDFNEVFKVVDSAFGKDNEAKLVHNGLHNIYGLVKYPKEFETL